MLEIDSPICVNWLMENWISKNFPGDAPEMELAKLFTCFKTALCKVE
jgi:hypothetical protein